jgi:16S rRNA (cytosine967-C5)-methyltransferase
MHGGEPRDHEVFAQDDTVHTFFLRRSRFLPISPARSIAYRILRGVEAGRGFAVDLLQTRDVSALKEADRRLATEIVMGVLRWRGELDFRIAEAFGKPVERLDPEVATILRLSVYQIQFLARVPKPAVVNEAVEMTKAARKRSAAGFVNALLRKFPPSNAGAPERFEDLDAAGRATVRRTVPNWLLERWAALRPGVTAAKAGVDSAGDDVALRLAWASTQVPPTVLRVVNPGDDISWLREELASDGVMTKPGKFSRRALVITSGNVQASQALRQGRVVIQDEASQLVVDLLMPQEEQRVLDLCAAPGVKAGQVAQSLGRGTLVTCDRSASRLRTMASLLPHWLPPEVRWLAVRVDATQALPFGCRFERILLDAPCSGTGTLARNPEIKWRLREADLERLAEAQAKMLKGALGYLDLGGRLVYATCSLEREENEGVVERVLAESPEYRLVSWAELESAHLALSLLLDPQGYLRTRPDLHNMDGFFAAAIERKS